MWMYSFLRCSLKAVVLFLVFLSYCSSLPPFFLFLWRNEDCLLLSYLHLLGVLGSILQLYPCRLILCLIPLYPLLILVALKCNLVFFLFPSAPFFPFLLLFFCPTSDCTENWVHYFLSSSALSLAVFTFPPMLHLFSLSFFSRSSDKTQVLLPLPFLSFCFLLSFFYCLNNSTRLSFSIFFLLCVV